MQLSRRRIRLACDARSTDQIKDVFTGAAPDGWNSNDTQLEIGIHDAGVLVTDISNIASLTASINALNDRKTAVVAPITLAAADLDGTVTQGTWEDGTKQHALIPLTNEQFNFDLGGETTRSFWLAVSVITNDTPARTYTVGTSILRILEDGTPPTGAPTPGDPLYLDANQSDARYYRPGPVNVLRPDGSHSRYEAVEDTDVARGDALRAAVAAALSGDVVEVGTSRFDIGANVLNFADGVSMYGQGINATVITGTPALTAQGCMIKPGSGSQLSDFATELPIDGTLRAAIGSRVGFQAAFTDVVIRNVKITGGSDGFYVLHSDPISAKLFSVTSETCYDNIVVNCAAATVEFYGSKFHSSGLHPVGDDDGEGNSAAIVAAGAIVRFFGCDLEVEQSSAGAAIAMKVLTGSTVSLTGCSVKGDGAVDISNSASTVEVAATRYTPSKVSGTVTVADAAAVRTAAAGPLFRSDRTGGGLLAITTGTFEKVRLENEARDTSGGFAPYSSGSPTTTSRWTPGLAGEVLVGGTVNFNGVAAGNRLILCVYKNGAEVARLNDVIAGGAGNCAVSGSEVIAVTATDYLELYVFHNKGSALNVEAGTFTKFWGHWVRP